MDEPRKPRLTIGKIMIVNVAVALLLAESRLGPSGMAVVADLLAMAWACFLAARGVSRLLDVFVGIRCPHCRQRGLRRMASPFSLTRYYRCGCGARVKCRWLSYRWQVASGAADEAVYRESSAGRWVEYTAPGADTDDTTCGTLLRGKRLRTAPRTDAAELPGRDDQHAAAAD